MSCVTWEHGACRGKGRICVVELERNQKQTPKVFLNEPFALSCGRESAVNLVRSGSYTRQPWRDESKGNEAPHSGAPTTYVSTYLKRYVRFSLTWAPRPSLLLLTRLPDFSLLLAACCIGVTGLGTLFC